jgi:hypothetical protein
VPRLLADGLRDARIAEGFVISETTLDHDVLGFRQADD